MVCIVQGGLRNSVTIGPVRYIRISLRYLFPVTINLLLSCCLADRVNGPCARTVDTVRVHGRHGRYGRVLAVYTCTWPVYETYRICKFLTNSCDYIRKQSILLVTGSGVKRDLG